MMNSQELLHLQTGPQEPIHHLQTLFRHSCVTMCTQARCVHADSPSWLRLTKVAGVEQIPGNGCDPRHLHPRCARAVLERLVDQWNTLSRLAAAMIRHAAGLWTPSTIAEPAGCAIHSEAHRKPLSTCLVDRIKSSKRAVCSAKSGKRGTS